MIEQRCAAAIKQQTEATLLHWHSCCCFLDYIFGHHFLAVHAQFLGNIWCTWSHPRLHATILFAYWVSVDFKILNPWDKIIKMSKNLTKKETFNIVVLSLLCPSRRSSSNKNETSLEADEPEHNHEGKLKTYREKKLVSADQPSLRRTSGAKDREIPQRLFVCS